MKTFLGAAANLARGRGVEPVPEQMRCVVAEIQDEASDVTAEAGSVVVDGPGGLAVTLTPRAAENTASRLTQAAAEARTQAPGEEPAA